ncbi:hypothetical protein CHISP_0041 [Chitinispirillum alkaliphilum]|nr:hypothetical protein CHISP_0041 [Chitinispirillum alkaliphilum]
MSVLVVFLLPLCLTASQKPAGEITVIIGFAQMQGSKEGPWGAAKGRDECI